MLFYFYFKVAYLTFLAPYTINVCVFIFVAKFSRPYCQFRIVFGYKLINVNISLKIKKEEFERPIVSKEGCRKKCLSGNDLSTCYWSPKRSFNHGYELLRTLLIIPVLGD